MDKYIGLLATASNKASYRKRPVETLDEVQKLATKSASKRASNREKQKEKYDSSTPRRVAITEARKKAGRKAFKEMTQKPNDELNKLLYAKRLAELRDAPPSEVDKINKEIDKLIGKQRKQEDLEKMLAKYKDQPTIYLAKLQEAKLEQEKESSSEVKQLLEQQQKILKAGLTAEQILRADDTFSSLPKTEQKSLIDYLKKFTPRDTVGRKEFAQRFIEASPSAKKEIIQSIAIPELSRGRIEEVSGDITTKQMKQDALSRFRYTSQSQKKYVKDKVFSDSNLQDIESIHNAIKEYMEEWESIQPKKTDITFDTATKKEKRRQKRQQNIAESVDDSAALEADEEISMAKGNPYSVLEEEIPIRDSIAEQFIDDGTTREEAIQDASEVVSKSREELAKNLDLATKTTLPESEDEEEPELSELEKRLNELRAQPPMTGTYNEYEKKLTDDAIEWAIKYRKPQINKNFGTVESFRQAVEDMPNIAEEVRMDYVNNASKVKTEPAPETKKQPKIDLGQAKINKMSQAKLFEYAEQKDIEIPDYAKRNVSETRRYLVSLQKGEEPTQKEIKKRGRKSKGKGFLPLTKYPHHLVAGALAKHITRVRNNRFMTNLNRIATSKNTDNEEYRKGLKQHLLRGGSFSNWFFTQ